MHVYLSRELSLLRILNHDLLISNSRSQYHSGFYELYNFFGSTIGFEIRKWELMNNAIEFDDNLEAMFGLSFLSERNAVKKLIKNAEDGYLFIDEFAIKDKCERKRQKAKARIMNKLKIAKDKVFLGNSSEEKRAHISSKSAKQDSRKLNVRIQVIDSSETDFSMCFVHTEDEECLETVDD